MIPLERWNVERRDNFLAKEEQLAVQAILIRLPIRLMELKEHLRSNKV